MAEGLETHQGSTSQLSDTHKSLNFWKALL